MMVPFFKFCTAQFLHLFSREEGSICTEVNEKEEEAKWTGAFSCARATEGCPTGSRPAYGQK